MLSSSGAESTVSSVFNDGYDSELLGDEEDRARLDEMTEKEREQEIYRRTEQRDLLARQFEMRKKIRQKERDAARAERRRLKAERARLGEQGPRNSKLVRVGSESQTQMCASYSEVKATEVRHSSQKPSIIIIVIIIIAINVMLPMPSYSFFLLLIPTNLCMKHPKKMPHFGQINFDRHYTHLLMSIIVEYMEWIFN